MVKLSFSRNLRLLTSEQFTFVFQQPKRINRLHISIFSRSNTLGYPRIGFIISKKNVKYAHERNRIKRIIRETFRLHQHELQSMDFVVLVKKGIVSLNNKNLSNELKQIWQDYYFQDHRS